jgi:DDE superfamily endonuclease
MLSSMSSRGMGPSLTVEGPTDTMVFEAYVEQVLAPTLRSGQVVVMDNLSAHKGERVREMIEERDCELIYLPSYSPDHRTPSRRPSRRSRGLCAKPKPGPEKPWSRRSVRRYRRSPLRTPMASSSTVATGCRSNHYGECCRASQPFYTWAAGG